MIFSKRQHGSSRRRRPPAWGAVPAMVWLVAAGLAAPEGASAQDNAAAAGPVIGDPYGPAAPSPQPQPRPEAASTALIQRLEQVERQTAALAEENARLREQLAESQPSEEAAAADEEIMLRLDTLEESEFDRMRREEYELKVYGFADVQWYKFFYDEKTMYEGYLNDNNSFGVGHWHMYLEKRLSESFRLLGEVRFLFQPYGEDYNYDSNFMGQQTVYERANVQATDWVDAYYFDWGGISIQRLWIEYKLNDMLGVRVGNYLTPYGIWNVDHASTVVIPAHRPFLITAKLLPESQTGLAIFGRFFPSDTTSIDYALTLSNGRGPTAKLYDLDQNKAGGASLSFSYDGPFSFSLGGYLFIGEYTDVVKGYEIDPMTFKTTFYTNAVMNYLEMTMAVHLKLSFKGLLLQGEYVRGLVRFKEGGRPVYAFQMDGITPLSYYPDYVQHAGYVLMAYRLPFETITLRPYFIYEYQEPSELSQLPVGHNFGPGINWQITPAVSWKFEVYFHREDRAQPRGGYENDELHYGVVTSQLAVSY